MLNTTQLLTLLQLPQMGRKSAMAIAEYASLREIKPNGLDELKDLIDECRKNKVVRCSKDYLDVEFETATAFALRIENDAETNGITISSYYDRNYPKALKALKKDGKNDSPLILFGKGDFNILNDRPAVAIIGTRDPSLAGGIASAHIAEEFAKSGFNIVSGLALGCDAAAHRGALKASGKTTAILAHGLGMVYPPENKGLANEIVENGGLLLSEYPMGTKPQLTYFVERDRLQAGAAQATIVVEAQAGSGARHALNTAIENQRLAYCTKLSDALMPANEGLLFSDGPEILTEDKLQSTIDKLKAEF